MQKKDKKILIIEDEPEVPEPLGELLVIEGCTVATATHPGLGAVHELPMRTVLFSTCN